MKFLRIIFLLTGLLFISCRLSDKEYRPIIDLGEEIDLIVKSKDYKPNLIKLKIDTFFILTHKYCSENRVSDNGVDLLYRCSNYALLIGDYKEALLYSKDVLNKYPYYKRNPEILFSMANLYDDFFKNKVKAYETYKYLIKKYPDSDFASEAKKAIMFLNKTEDEIIKQLEK